MRSPGDRSRASRPGASLGRLLIASVVAVDLFVVGLVAAAMQHGLREHRALAVVTGENLARLLEAGLSASFDKIDLALLATVDAHQQLASTGQIDGRAFQEFLTKQKDRTPDLLTLRTTDARGITQYNVPELSEQVSLADRDFFAPLRDDPTAGLFISRPYMGRIIRTPVMIFSRRLSAVDGAFAGAVIGSVELSRLNRILSGLDVGSRGILTLRWRDLSLVARRGAGNNDIGLGEANVSPELRDLVASGRLAASYDARSGLDGVQRTFAFRKFDRYPLYVVVGLALDDYLAEWRRQAAVTSALVTCFLLLSVAGAWFGYGAWRRRLEFERLLIERTESLRESEERFRTAFQTSPDAIILSRVADGVHVAVNEGFSRVTGWTEAEVLGRSSLALGIWDDPGDRVRLVKELQRNGFVENLEARFRRKDGRAIVGLMSARLIRLRGEALHLSIARDITDRKWAEEERDRLREQVQQAQRLESIGRLAGGVAHDFNNLLTVILSCCESLKEQLGARAPDQLDDVDQICAAGGRARDLTRQLLGFARRQVIAPVPLDLGLVVRSSEKLLRRILGEDVSLQVELGEGLWPVLCDPGQIEQVLLNLVVNAREAMPAGGSLTIEASNAEIGPQLEPQRSERAAGQWVRLSVRDSGTGMSPEVQGHVFEPFFTTKGPGKGTGLGLAMVHGIVAQNGGHIEVSSKIDRGTAFDVYLPRTKEIVASPIAPPERATRRGNETVLLLEDDPQVRAVTLRALDGAGYRVLVASTGKEALDVVERHSGRLDLVVADVIMPGLSGPEVVDQLRRRRPGLRVLYVSGYPQETIAQRGVLEMGIEFLPKPFTAASLLARVRAVIDA